MAVAIAAAKVHPAVDRRRIALQHLFDQADALEELAPVERRHQAQAANQVRHERLFGRLMPRFGSDRILDRLASRGQRGVELVTGRGGFVLTRPLQQADHEGRMHLRRPSLALAVARFERPDQPIRFQALGAAGREDVGPRPQLFDQRLLQRRRPGPELAHRQRRNRLECGDESVQTLRIEAPRAAPDQLERQRVDARLTGELVGRDARQPAEERRRQIVLNVAKRRDNDVEVVEQPLRRRRGRFAATRVLGQRLIDLAQRPRVSVQRRQVHAGAAAPALRDGQESGETSGMFFERLDAEQLDSARPRPIVGGVTHRSSFLYSSSIRRGRSYAMVTRKIALMTARLS